MVKIEEEEEQYIVWFELQLSCFAVCIVGLESDERVRLNESIKLCLGFGGTKNIYIYACKFG